MGMNYYLIENVCEHCGVGKQKKHIGKSSFGWYFGLYVDDEIADLNDWERMFNDPKTAIEDEYEKSISVEQMLSIIKERKGPDNIENKPMGYKSWADYYLMNFSERGMNNLLRHKINGHHCVGHGEGTWDYVTGDFS